MYCQNAGALTPVPVIGHFGKMPENLMFSKVALSVRSLNIVCHLKS